MSVRIPRPDQRPGGKNISLKFEAPLLVQSEKELVLAAFAFPPFFKAFARVRPNSARRAAASAGVASSPQRRCCNAVRSALRLSDLKSVAA